MREKEDLWGTMGYEHWRERELGPWAITTTFSIFQGNLLNKTIIFSNRLLETIFLYSACPHMV